MIPEDIVTALRILHGRLEGKVEWMIITSLAAALQGVDLEVDDIDITTPYIYATHRLLDDFVIKDPKQETVYYDHVPYEIMVAAYQIENVDIDVIELGVSVNIGGRSTGLENKRTINLGDLYVPVLPLPLVQHVYSNIDQEKDKIKAAKIEAFLSAQKN